MLKKSLVLRKIRNEMQAGNQLGVSIARAGVRSPNTISQWRKRKMIDRYFDTLMMKSDSKRVSLVEDSFLKKLVEGRASAADYEFFLVNRASEKWKSPAKIVVSQSNSNTNCNQVNVISNLKDNELDELARTIIERRQGQPH